MAATAPSLRTELAVVDGELRRAKRELVRLDHRACALDNDVQLDLLRRRLMESTGTPQDQTFGLWHRSCRACCTLADC